MDFSDKDEKHSVPSDNATEVRSAGIHDVNEGEMVTAGSQHLHRKLRGKEVQLFAVGGAIGTCMDSARNAVGIYLLADCPYTALFVQMGAVLPKGGPAGLFLGFLAYGSIILAVNECFGEPSSRTPTWNARGLNMYSGNGDLPPHSVTLRPARWLLG